MSHCILGLMEEWYGTRDSGDFARVVESENIRGLERLHKLISNRDIEHQAIAAVRALLVRLHGCATLDELLTSYNFLCQRFFSPLPSVLEYLFSLPSSTP